MSQIDETVPVSDPAKTTTTPPPAPYRPLRIWPAIVLLVLMVVFRNIAEWWENAPSMIWAAVAFGPALCSILLLFWWGIASRASGREKLVGFAWIILALVVCVALLHPTMLGPAITVMTIPMGIGAFAFAAVLLSRWLSFQRTLFACLLATIGFGVSDFYRSPSGMWGNFAIDLESRFSPTSEERLANRDSGTDLETATGDSIDQELLSPEWPGFRGPNRDGIEHGTVLPETVSASDIKEIWRIPVGPGWASFADAGNLLFTQEQRGQEETIVCYAADSGKEVWFKAVPGRFDDPLGGPGPRATPTLAGGSLYAMGALGDLMKLDPKSGNELWHVDIKEVSGASVPMWGFAASPLVTNDVVIVYAGAKEDKGLLAFDVNHGELKWSAPCGEFCYSSAQLARVLDEELILMTSNTGIDFYQPSTGEVTFHYEWPHEGYRADQPAIVDETSIIIPTGMGTGTRRINLSKSDEGEITAEEVWTTLNMKPDFNDVVIDDGYLYGFDNTIYACLDLSTGDRKWKGGRYGKGQQLLLKDSGMILVMTEEGELKLLKATPEKLTEIVSMKLLDGKTWNHPVVVGNRAYIRNFQEAVCLELPIAQPPTEVVER